VADYQIPLNLFNCVIDNIQLGSQIRGEISNRILEGDWEGTEVVVKEDKPCFYKWIRLSGGIYIDKPFNWMWAEQMITSSKLSLLPWYRLPSFSSWSQRA